MMENRGFWEVLEPIKALYTNKDGHSYIRVGFRELHSENKIPRIRLRELNLENYIHKNIWGNYN